MASKYKFILEKGSNRRPPATLTGMLPTAPTIDNGIQALSVGHIVQYHLPLTVHLTTEWWSFQLGVFEDGVVYEVVQGVQVVKEVLDL